MYQEFSEEKTFSGLNSSGGGGGGGDFFKNKVITVFTLALSLSNPSALCVGHSIKELYVKVDLIVNGKTIFTYSETLCEPGLSKLIFCGKKKGGR